MDTFFEHLTIGYFDFKGTSSRKDFWIYILSLMIINTVCLLVLGLIYVSDATVRVNDIHYGDITEAMHWISRADGLFVSAMVIFSVWYIYLIIPTLAITVRRLHDTGRSGWWVAVYAASVAMFLLGIFPQLFSVLAAVLSFAILIFCLMKGENSAEQTLQTG